MARRKGYRRLNRPNRKSHKQRSNSKPVTAQAHSKPDSQHGSELANQPASSPQTISDAVLASPEAIPITGSGGRYIRHEESGLRHLEHAKLEQRAIKHGWAGKAGWNLDQNAQDFADMQAKQGGLLTIRQNLELGVLNGVLNHDPRVVQVAVRSGVTMHGQNQAAEHHGERMDYHERALAGRAGMRGGDLNLNVESGGGVSIFIPWNGRDALPADAIQGGPAIEGSAVPFDDQDIDPNDQEFQE